MNKGIVRRIDDLGRIVIPKEIRDVLNINKNDFIEIIVDDEKIILLKKEFQINLDSFIKSYIYSNFTEDFHDLLITKANLEEIDNILHKYVSDIKK